MSVQGDGDRDGDEGGDGSSLKMPLHNHIDCMTWLHRPGASVSISIGVNRCCPSYVLLSQMSFSVLNSRPLQPYLHPQHRQTVLIGSDASRTPPSPGV